jgi:hypothetical protein
MVVLAAALGAPVARAEVVPVEDAMGRETVVFRNASAVSATDAVGREATVFRESLPLSNADDAFSREFVAFGQSPPPAPTDAFSREWVAFRQASPVAIADGFSREFVVYNDTLSIEPVDAFSREFTAFRPDRPAEIVDAMSRESKIWCLTPADAPKEGVPAQFMLRSARPNPFERTTELTYGLPREATVSLEVYDAGGRLTAQVLRERKETAGWHTARIDAAGWPSGVYFYRFRAGEIRRTGKIVVHR